MSYYAQFYRRFTREDGSSYYEEGVGDRQIIRLDGRTSLANMCYVAGEHCLKRGYDAFRIGKGQILPGLRWLTTVCVVAKEDTGPTNTQRTDNPRPSLKLVP